MRRLYTYYIYMLLAALGLPGCELIHDDDMDCQLYTPEGVPYAYVSIALSTAMTPSTRANPEGGEEGDGPEPGQDYENQVNDITLFFYEATGDKTDKGVNSAAETKVIRQYFGNNDINYTTGQQASTNTVPVEELLVNHDYHVLAVVNGGEGFGTNIQTLGDLQRETVKELYKVEGTGDDATYTNFLMASADDENQPLHIIPSNSETNPATTRIDVERVTARVDYRAIDPNGETPNDNIYEIDGVGTAKITGAMLVNTLNANQSSYLLKRVTKEKEAFSATDIVYLGKETPTPSGVATNYVIEPLSGQKNADKSMAAYYDNYFHSFDYGNADDWESLFTPGTSVKDSEGAEWYRIGYPKENTAEKSSSFYTTGIVFRAEICLGEATKAKTFFEYYSRRYTTLEDLMAGVEGSQDWSVINGTWNPSWTWSEFQSNIIDKLEDSDPIGYKAFLERQLPTDLSETVANSAALRWAAYAEASLYYKKNENGTVTLDLRGGDTRLALSQIYLETDGTLPETRVRTYKDGIAYYTYWIKHSNDNNEGAEGIMEYGIVRNNLYQLNVTGISMVGDDTPGGRSLQISVTVRDWEMKDPEDINMLPEKEDETE